MRFCSFYVLLTPPLFHPNFGGVPVAADRTHVRVSGSRCLKLFGREIIFEVYSNLCDHGRLNVTDYAHRPRAYG